jgi:hypothetical protein
MSKKGRNEPIKYQHIGTEEALHQVFKIVSSCNKVSYLLYTLDEISLGNHDFVIKFTEKLPMMSSYKYQPYYK